MEAVNRVKNKSAPFEEFRDNRINQTQRIYGTIKELRSGSSRCGCIYRERPDLASRIIEVERQPCLLAGFWGDRVRRIAYAASFGVDKCPSGASSGTFRTIVSIRCPVRTRGKRGFYLPSSRKRGGTCP